MKSTFLFIALALVDVPLDSITCQQAYEWGAKQCLDKYRGKDYQECKEDNEAMMRECLEEEAEL